MSTLPDLLSISEVPAGITADALSAACDAVRDYCGWHIAPSFTETRTIDGPGGDLLVLPTLYLTDLKDVTSDGQAVDDPEWSQSGMVRRRCWSRKFRGIEVTMTHGYDTCPEALKGVVVSMAARGTAGPGASMTVAGPFTMTYGSAMQGGATGFLEAHRTVLDRYRLPGLA